MKRHNLFLALLAVACAACAGTAPNVLHVQAGPAGVGSTKIEINDRYLERAVDFGEVSIRALDAAGSYEVQVPLTNRTERDLSFEYRFMWYDARGFELSTVTSWLPVVLGAQETRGFRSVSPAAAAASFKLMVRSSKPVTPTGS